MPDESTVPEFYATAPISVPVIVPEAEDVPMNGFAWSAQFGLLLAFGDGADPILDELARLRVASDNIRIGDQGLRDDT